MGTLRLEDIIVTPLKRIPTVGGDVMHVLKNSDTGFNGFGEAYFSWVEQGAIKAWKCHQHMTLNLVVPLGQVRFAFHLPQKNKDFRIEDVGEERYVRLTVPSGIWFGFQGRASGPSLLMNIANLEHSPGEVDRKELNAFPFSW
tara:strand:+ start:464 stop:892 length:429 start_codon:yes stop_codon:yes gene_type:complete